MMRLNRWVPVALVLAVAAGGCDDILDVDPRTAIGSETAIVDAISAQAALNGVYSAFQDGGYYGGDFPMMNELLSDNADHWGTFTGYAEADRIAFNAETVELDNTWSAIYLAIARANLVIDAVPTLSDVDPATADEILGEAYALRAVAYHDLVRAWGPVPLVLEPTTTVEEATDVSGLTRASVSSVYAQIVADLGQAEALLESAGTSNFSRTFITPGAVDALQARVQLFLEGWANAEAEAMEVVNSGDYGLVRDFTTLFEGSGARTEEDIFRVAFTPSDFNNYGYYMQFAGRYEVGPSLDLYFTYDPADERGAWTIRYDPDIQYIDVNKYPTTIGAEDYHLIRYAEVLLTLAEAHARQGELTDAVAWLNEVHTRAGLPAYDLATDFGGDAQAVLEAIWLERRLELAFENDRWFDLVRTGMVFDVLGLDPVADGFRTLWPIPQGELDVAPGLDQNPGY